MKSAAVSADDIGETVYIWLGDTSGREVLALKRPMEALEEIKVPQVRDPNKKKDAYRVTLSDMRADITLPLTTDDLGPCKICRGGGRHGKSGRMHRDRNDKILRLTGTKQPF